MLKLILQACGNPDHEENPWDISYNGKYWEKGSKYYIEG